MGKIRKEGGKWVVDFRLPRALALKYGRQRFRKGYSRRQMAEKIHGLVAVAIETGDIDGKLARLLNHVEHEYTVRSFYERWMEEYCKPRLEKNTIVLYQLNFKTLNEYFGDVPLHDIRRQHLHGYVQKRSLQVSATTVNKDIIAVKSMFSFACEVGALEANPLAGFPTLRVQEKPLRIPTPEEFRALIDAMPDPAIAAMVTIMGETGLRRKEAIRLEWKNVDLAGRKLMVEMTKSKRTRQVPLSDFAIDRLRSLVRFVHQPRIFCHQQTGDPWLSPDKAFRAGRKKAGLPWVRMHTLRHMRAVRWIEYGANIEAVREDLGHKSIQTTHRYARHAQDTAMEAIREAQRREAAAGEKRETVTGGKE